MENLAKADKLGKLLRYNKRLERKLSRIETLFNAIRAAIIVIESDGSIHFANAFAKDILHISESQSIFKVISGIEDSIELLKKDGGETAVMREFEVDYPERRLLSAQIIPFDFGGSNTTYAIVLNDITKEKLSEAERLESEKIASVLNLASGVAHELGNPLNSINIHLQLAKRRIAKLSGNLNSGEVLSDISDSIEICSSEVHRLNGIIENFLKALRPLKPNMSECDPIKPLAEILKTLNCEIVDMNVAIFVNTDNPLPKVYADENLLKQLYFNLLKNSLESMQRGGSITITAKALDEFVCIEFSDTGCGIDEDNMAKLFTPYFTTKPTGHGLGMTIIASIVRAHGGKIDVESKQGKGTKISVFIPRNERRIRMLEV